MHDKTVLYKTDSLSAGPVQIAAVGVSIAVFNQASKVTIFPLVSITTSFVAEENTVKKMSDEQRKSDDMEKGSTFKNKDTKADDSVNQSIKDTEVEETGIHS